MPDALDRLRRAAKTLRDAAEAATDGPWTYLARNIIDTPVIDVDEANWGGEGLRGYRLIACGDDGAWREADVRYIALVDPVVGATLAHWLDVEADAMETSIEIDGFDAVDMADGWSEALATARAILREEAADA